MSNRADGSGAIVVMAAMPRELRPLVRTLGLRSSGLSGLPAWRGGDLLAVAVGVGPRRAGAGARRVLDGVTARKLLVVGVAGAADRALEVGDIVRPAMVVDASTHTTFAPRVTDGRAGVLLTVDRADAPPSTGGTAAVDMESAAIVAEAEARGVPWDVVRAISDTPGTLTAAVAAVLRPDGRTDLWAAVRLVARDPASAPRLVRLGVGSVRATRAVTRAVVADLAAEGVTTARRGLG